MKTRTICLAGMAWLAATAAWAQPGRVQLRSGETIEARTLRMEAGRYRLVLADGSEREVLQAEVRSVQFLEEASEIDRLVKDLGASDHAAREGATQRLIGLLEHDRQRILAALPKESPDPEVRMRAAQIRERAEPKLQDPEAEIESIDLGQGVKMVVPKKLMLQQQGAIAIPPEVAKMVPMGGGIGGAVVVGGVLPMPPDPGGPVGEALEEALPEKDVPPSVPGEIGKLVKDLGSEGFEPRDQATARLMDLARTAEKPEVLKALPADPQDPEVKARVESIRQAAVGRRRPAAVRNAKVSISVAVADSRAGEDGGFVGEVRMDPGVVEGDAEDPMGAILESIAEDLEDESPEIRAAAVRNAGRVMGDRPKEALAKAAAKLLIHDEEGIRHSAAQALGKLVGEKWPGDERGVAAAKEWLKSRDAERKAEAK